MILEWCALFVQEEPEWRYRQNLPGCGGFILILYLQPVSVCPMKFSSANDPLQPPVKRWWWISNHVSVWQVRFEKISCFLVKTYMIGLWVCFSVLSNWSFFKWSAVNREQLLCFSFDQVMNPLVCGACQSTWSSEVHFLNFVKVILFLLE